MVIGSTAIKYWFPDFPRKPKDCDIIKDSCFVPAECEKLEWLDNPILLEYCPDMDYLEPTYLLTLKISHIFWNINWDKHMWDIQFLLDKGVEFDEKLFQRLYDYWNEYHGKNKRSDLKMTSEDFFDNALDSEYNHDWLHTLLQPIPTYTKILKDGAEVEVSEEKFNKLTYEEKCSLVREEVYVMAFERYKKDYWAVAYSKMLKKFIISHAPMWEAFFIIRNYKELCRPEYNYRKKIEDGIKANKQVVI